MNPNLTSLSALNAQRRDDPALRITATDMIERLNDFVYECAHELAVRRGAPLNTFAHDRAADDLVWALAQFLTQSEIDPAAVVRASQLTDLHAGDMFGTTRMTGTHEDTIVTIEEGEE